MREIKVARKHTLANPTRTYCQLNRPLPYYLNKISAESGVAPTGIKSHKFLFVLKKIYFAVLKKLMG